MFTLKPIWTPHEGLLPIEMVNNVGEIFCTDADGKIMRLEWQIIDDDEQEDSHE